MPEVVPSIIAPYLEQGSAAQSLMLVTSTLSTPAHWVLLRHVYAALHSAKVVTKGDDSRSETASTVIFVSLVRPRDLWLELSRKIVSRSTRRYANTNVLGGSRPATAGEKQSFRLH